MDVNKSSTFYRFLNENWFSTDDRMPENLCPFMRKVLGTTLVNFVLGLVVVFFASCMFWSAVGIIGGWGLLSSMTEAMAIMGTILWIVLVGGLLIAGVNSTGVAQAAGHKVAGSNSFHVTAGWFVAMHEKVCPRIDFKE